MTGHPNPGIIAVREEQQLLRDVIELCDKHHVLWYHDFDSTRNPRGFPDLVLVGQKAVMFAELKSSAGQMRHDQITWKWRLMATGQPYAIWRPSDLESGHIESVLQNL